MNVADRELLSIHPTYAALKDLNRPVEMWIYPDEHHAKWQPAHRLAIYNRNVDWFNFWLRGKEDTDPAKAEQYKRWKELRALQGGE